MISKIFTASWLKPEDINFKVFSYPEEEKDGRTYTRNQLLKLLDLDSNSSLSIVNNEYAEQDPSKLLSLSHGQKAGAVICVSRKAVDGVGIDIELVNRRLSERSMKFFINSFDENPKKNALLEMWTKKEAAFKAAAPKISTIKVLNHLWIHGHSFGIVGSEKPLGEVGATRWEDQIIATAYLSIT